MDIGQTEIEITPSKETKEKMVKKQIPIEREGRTLNVNLRTIDFRESENDKAPINIFCSGFGISEEGDLSKLDNEQLEEAKKMGALFMAVGIEEIPPAYDEKSDQEASPTTDVDARVIIDGLKDQNINLAHAPVSISGFSEGAAVAISMAGEVNKIQSEAGKDKLPQNTLRLWSLTGAIDISENDPRGINMPSGFIREVSIIALTETMKRYQEATGENPGTIKDKHDLVQFGKKLASLVKTKEGRRMLLSQLGEAKEGNIAILMGVLKRLTKAEKFGDILSQFKKLEKRNPVCDQLGKNWRVKMVLPRRDQIYPWVKVKNTLLKLGKGKIQESSETSIFRQIVKQKLFPNAREVDFEIVGERGGAIGEGWGFEHSHLGPIAEPKLFVSKGSLI